jgi:hypothetical protein
MQSWYLGINHLISQIKELNPWKVKGFLSKDAFIHLPMLD